MMKRYTKISFHYPPRKRMTNLSTGLRWNLHFKGNIKSQFVIQCLEKFSILSIPCPPSAGLHVNAAPFTFVAFCYVRQKEQMMKKSGGKVVNQQYLFHGTDKSLVEAICEQNFDWRMCGVHGTAYGKGTAGHHPQHKCLSVFTLLSKQWSTKLRVFMTKDGLLTNADVGTTAFLTALSGHNLLVLRFRKPLYTHTFLVCVTHNTFSYFRQLLCQRCFLLRQIFQRENFLKQDHVCCPGPGGRLHPRVQQLCQAPAESKW